MAIAWARSTSGGLPQLGQALPGPVFRLLGAQLGVGLGDLGRQGGPGRALEGLGPPGRLLQQGRLQLGLGLEEGVVGPHRGQGGLHDAQWGVCA